MQENEEGTEGRKERKDGIEYQQIEEIMKMSISKFPLRPSYVYDYIYCFLSSFLSYLLSSSSVLLPCHVLIHIMLSLPTYLPTYLFLSSAQGRLTHTAQACRGKDLPTPHLFYLL